MSTTPLTTALLTSFVCALSFACSPSADAPAQARADAPPLPVETAKSSSSPTPAEPAASPTPTSGPASPAPVIDEPVLASTTALPSSAQPESPTAAAPELPLSKGDKPPVGAVGASGIHLDEITVGKGWAASRCEDLGTRFAVETDERVNVCFRVVHPSVAETVTVEWARDGKLRQSIAVSVKPSHAYRTRAWLPVSAGRVGDWTATVKSEDGMVLGQVAFEIAE